MKINVYTLGCKVNQCESQALCDLLNSRGHTAVMAEDGITPDACIVNTCAVTSESEMKGRKLLSKVRRQFPGAITVLCGCMPQVADISAFNADIIVGSKNRSAIPELLERYRREGTRIEAVSRYLPVENFESISEGGAYESRTRGFLKIEDGCDRFCSYCIIPAARGPVRSMRLDEIEKQAAMLTAAGHREIVLTGINLAAFGQDTGFTLGDAVTAAARSGADRIRLGSVEADLLDDRFLDTLAACPAFCPQFHLSLQSGSDGVLKRMNRRYDTRQYYELTEKINRIFDNPSLTTDVMVGFPAESDEELNESLAFVEKVGFARLHVFTYSLRPSTLAATMPQVSPAVKKERAEKMSALGAELAKRFAASQVGKLTQVLFETRRGKTYQGWSANYISVCAQSDIDLRNKICEVEITASDGPVCEGAIKKVR